MPENMFSSGGLTVLPACVRRRREPVRPGKVIYLNRPTANLLAYLFWWFFALPLNRPVHFLRQQPEEPHLILGNFNLEPNSNYFHDFFFSCKDTKKSQIIYLYIRIFVYLGTYIFGYKEICILVHLYISIFVDLAIYILIYLCIYILICIYSDSDIPYLSI